MDKYLIKHYQQGFYTCKQFKKFVKSGEITIQQYQETTGEKYTE